MPGSEIPDSSSFHSNESNESHYHPHSSSVSGNYQDPRRDIETLNEENEIEFNADLYRSNRISPSLSGLDSGNEEYRFTTGIFIFI